MSGCVTALLNLCLAKLSSVDDSLSGMPPLAALTSPMNALTQSRSAACGESEYENVRLVMEALEPRIPWTSTV